MDMMRREVPILVSLLVLLGPLFTDAHHSHKHVFQKMDAGLCSVDCEDVSHQHNTLNCDKGFQTSRYLPGTFDSIILSYDFSSTIKTFDSGRISSDNWYSCPQGRAPPYISTVTKT